VAADPCSREVAFPQRAPANSACDPEVPSEKGAQLVVPRTSMRPRMAWADMGSDSECASFEKRASEVSTQPGSSCRSVGLASLAPLDGGDSGGLPGWTRGHVELVEGGGPTRGSAQACTGQSSSPVVTPHRWKLKNRKVYERDGKLGIWLGASAEAPSAARPGEGGDSWAATPCGTEWLAPRRFGPGAAPSRHGVRQLQETEESAELTRPSLSVQPMGNFVLPRSGRGDADDEGLVSGPHIPLGESGEFASVGSLKHVEGSCKPCAFVYTPIGCKLNVRCAFCHVLHRRKERRRLGKKKRERYQDLVSQVVRSNQRQEADWECHWQTGRCRDSLSRWGLSRRDDAEFLPDIWCKSVTDM